MIPPADKTHRNPNPRWLLRWSWSWTVGASSTPSPLCIGLCRPSAVLNPLNCRLPRFPFRISRAGPICQATWQGEERGACRTRKHHKVKGRTKGRCQLPSWLMTAGKEVNDQQAGQPKTLTEKTHQTGATMSRRRPHQAQENGRSSDERGIGSPSLLATIRRTLPDSPSG